MGAWGTDSFENDDALDWVGNDFEGSEDLSIVADALATVANRDDDDYLEVTESCAAVAAAEVLAGVLQRPSATLPDDIRAWLAEHSGLDGTSLAPTALRALDRVERNSELQGLWDDSDSAAQWRQAIANLKSRVGS